MRGCESGRSLLTGDVAGMCNRFQKYVDIPLDMSRCWTWKGGRRTANGYGCFKVGDRVEQSHRVAVALSGRNILPNTVVLHSCDNKLCVNPAHLSLGTQQDNVTDATRKGRQKLPRVSGETHPSAKLTRDQVVEIRWAVSRGSESRELARMYGVSESLICQIVRRKIWKHVAP